MRKPSQFSASIGLAQILAIGMAYGGGAPIGEILPPRRDTERPPSETKPQKRDQSITAMDSDRLRRAEEKRQRKAAKRALKQGGKV